jgi:hypothetical protein
VGPDRLVLDALGRRALEKRVEADDPAELRGTIIRT